VISTCEVALDIICRDVGPRVQGIYQEIAGDRIDSQGLQLSLRVISLDLKSPDTCGVVPLRFQNGRFEASVAKEIMLLN